MALTQSNRTIAVALIATLCAVVAAVIIGRSCAGPSNRHEQQDAGATTRDAVAALTRELVALPPDQCQERINALLAGEGPDGTANGIAARLAEVRAATQWGISSAKRYGDEAVKVVYRLQGSGPQPKLTALLFLQRDGKLLFAPMLP
jgi:hypothetical protein